MRIRTGLRRVTTNMVSNSRRRTGLVSRRGARLNSSSSGRTGLLSSRLDYMNTSSVQSSRLLRSSYEKLQKSAVSLTEQSKLLAEKVDIGGKDISATAAEMLADFNDTMKYLKQSSGVLNDFYRQSFKETVTSNKKELEQIGITVGTDGTLSLNKEKLAGAEEEKVKKLLGSSSDFLKRIDTVAARVADNARGSAENVSSRYNSSGNLASSYLSKYNFWG